MTLVLRISAILLACGVGAGAFGAHALRGVLSEADIGIWEKAVHYHLFHSLAILIMGALANRWIVPSRALPIAVMLLLSTCIFSGSLYLLVLLNARWLGAITPLGGAGFIISWVALACSIGTNPHTKPAPSVPHQPS